MQSQINRFKSKLPFINRCTLVIIDENMHVFWVTPRGDFREKQTSALIFRKC